MKKIADSLGATQRVDQFASVRDVGHTTRNSQIANRVKGREALIAFSAAREQPSQMRRGRGKLLDPAAIGERLRVTREALGLDQRGLCRAVDVGESSYNQFEKGSRPLTIGPALKLCRRFGLTLDWLYRGDPSGLPVRLVEQLPPGTIEEEWPRAADPKKRDFETAPKAMVPPRYAKSRRRTGALG